MHGHIERRPRSGGGYSYRITYVAGKRPDGTPDRRRATYDTKREAEKALARLDAAADNGTLVNPKKQSFGAYMEEWLSNTKRLRIEDTTMASYTYLIRMHIIPALGAIPLQRIRAAQIEGFLVDRATSGRLDGKGGLSDRTVRYLHALITSALGDAYKRQLIPSNQAVFVTPPARRMQDRAEHHIWTDEQLSLFLAHAKADRFWPLWPLALTTGLRRQELLGLRWSDVDLRIGVLRVVQVVVKVGGVVLVKPRAKNRSSHRTMSIDERTVALLRDHQTAQAFTRKRLENQWQHKDLLFTTELGGLVAPPVVSAAFCSMVKRLGLPEATMHDLRHMMATYGLTGGMDLIAVSRRLGHSQPSTTTDIYAGLRPAADRQLADALGEAIFGRVSPFSSPKADQA